jgi:hypothetical protein
VAIISEEEKKNCCVDGQIIVLLSIAYIYLRDETLNMSVHSNIIIFLKYWFSSKVFLDMT